MPYRLVSTSGDQTFELQDGRTLVVGRGITSDIAIYDPTISRRHAELAVGADGVEVKDLGSSNGTFINGARITAGRLGLEDSVTFGKVVFRLTTPGSVGRRPAAPRPRRGGRPRRRADRPAARGERRRAAGHHQPGPPAGWASSGWRRRRGEARQALKLQMLLEVSQKLSGELDLDRLLRDGGRRDVRDHERGPGHHRAPERGDGRARADDLPEPRSATSSACRSRDRSPTRSCRSGSRSCRRTPRRLAASGASRSCSRACGAPCAPRSWPPPTGCSACCTSTTSTTTQHLHRRGPAVPRRVQRPRRHRHQELALRRADPPRGHRAVQLRALLRAERRGRHRAAGRRHPAGRRAAPDHRAVQRHPGLHRHRRVAWDRTPSPSSSASTSPRWSR